MYDSSFSHLIDAPRSSCDAQAVINYNHKRPLRGQKCAALTESWSIRLHPLGLPLGVSR